MKIKFYFLKYNNQYIRSNKGAGSVHLTNRLSDADRFSDKKSAKSFLQSIMNNEEDYIIDYTIMELEHVKIVSERID